MKPLQRLKEYNTKGNLWIYILSLLLRKDKIHAWLLQCLIEENFGFKPGKITSYRVLYRLEKQGLVKSKTEKRRRVYQITKKGEKELELAKKFYQETSNKLK